MGQLGFFDLSRRYEELDAKNDPLVPIATLVAWESFRPKLKAALIKGELRKHDAERRSSAGRKPWDEVVIFKALVLQALYNLSDDQAEYQLRDRYSFGRFLGLGLEDAVPDAKTLWLYRETLAQAGVVEELFDLFDGFLKDKGYLAMGGQIIDATIVSAPKQHNSREENETIKDGETPKDWKRKPAKNRQKHKDARLTKKNERSYFGYKNYISVEHAKLLWRIERDYQELKQELGLDHYEGRGWRGFHHHTALCVAAYGFLISERSSIPPSGVKTTILEAPRLSDSYRPRGSADQTRTPRRLINREHPHEVGARLGATAVPMSVLPTKNSPENFMTQQK